MVIYGNFLTPQCARLQKKDHFILKNIAKQAVDSSNDQRACIHKT